MRMKNNHQKQKFCCRWTTKSCGIRSKNYNQKCSWKGRVHTTKHHWKCKNIKVGRFGHKKRCCRHTRVCNGLKCKTKRGKCQFRGCLKTRQTIRRCKIKKLTKNVKCRYCCRKVKKCDCGVCRFVNTKCSCQKNLFHLDLLLVKELEKEEEFIKKDVVVIEKFALIKNVKF